MRFVKTSAKEKLQGFFRSDLRTDEIRHFASEWPSNDWGGVGKYLVNRLATYEVRDNQLKFTDFVFPEICMPK